MLETRKNIYTHIEENYTVTYSEKTDFLIACFCDAVNDIGFSYYRERFIGSLSVWIDLYESRAIELEKVADFLHQVGDEENRNNLISSFSLEYEKAKAGKLLDELIEGTRGEWQGAHVEIKSIKHLDTLHLVLMLEAINEILAEWHQSLFCRDGQTVKKHWIDKQKEYQHFLDWQKKERGAGRTGEDAPF